MATLLDAKHLTEVSFPILKFEDDADGNLVVEGVVTDGSVDADRQVVDLAWSRKALAEWMDSSTGPNIRVMHSPHLYPAGRGLQVELGDTAHRLKALVVEDTAKKLVRNRVLTSFSIGVSGAVVDRDVTGKASNGIVRGGVLAEVSLVDRPSNGSCKFTLAKFASDVDTPWTYGDLGELLAKAEAAGLTKSDSPEDTHPAAPGPQPTEPAPVALLSDADTQSDPTGEQQPANPPTGPGEPVDEIRKAYDTARAAWQARKPKAPDMDARDGTAYLAKMVAVTAWDRWDGEGDTEGFTGPDSGGYERWAAKHAAPSAPPLLVKGFDPNVGGGVERSDIPAEDFIDRKGRRFPIVIPGDVSDAVASYGRAKPLIPMRKFRSRLKAIARRKGPEFEAALPESWGDATVDKAARFGGKRGRPVPPPVDDDDDLLPLLGDDEPGNDDEPKEMEPDLTKDDDDPAEAEDMMAPCPGCGDEFDMSNPPKKCPNCKHRLARLIGKAVDAVLAETEELLAKASEADLLKWKHGWIPEPGDLSRLAQGLRGRKREKGKPSSLGSAAEHRHFEHEPPVTAAEVEAGHRHGQQLRRANAAAVAPKPKKSSQKPKTSYATDTGERISPEEAGRRMFGDKGYERRTSPKKAVPKTPKPGASPKVEKSHTPGHGPTHELPEHREPDGAMVEQLEDNLDQQEPGEHETPETTPTSTMGADDATYKTLRMHDVLCPAYHPEDALAAHNLASLTDGLHPRWFDARVLKAAAAGDPGGIIQAARLRDNATALRELPDDTLLQIRYRMHDRFGVANPSAFCIPTITLPKAAKLWGRPWPMTPGVGPSPARTPSVDDVATQLLTDNYRPVGGLSSGHVARSWDELSAQAAANTILALHDHIAGPNPGMCPMVNTLKLMPPGMRAGARPTPTPAIPEVTKTADVTDPPNGKASKTKPAKPAMSKRQVDELVKTAIAEATTTLHDTYQTQIAQLRREVDELGGQPDVTQAPLRSAVRKMASPDSEAVAVERTSLVEKAHRRSVEQERVEYLQLLLRGSDPQAREWALTQLGAAAR